MHFRQLIFILTLALPAFGATVSISPSNLNVAPGQSFTVDVAVSGVTDLYGFGFDLGFNSAVLAATGITERTFLPGGGLTFFIAGTIDNGAGSLTGTGDVLLTAISGVSGGGVLARASFTAVGAGSSGINLFGVTLLDSSLSGIAVTAQNGAVSVSAAAPEPSELVLLSGGLLWLILRRRKVA